MLNIFDILSERGASNSLVVCGSRSHSCCGSSDDGDGCFTSPPFFYTEVSFKALVDQALNMHKLFVEQ
jgi:hypothetical protein